MVHKTVRKRYYFISNITFVSFKDISFQFWPIFVTYDKSYFYKEKLRYFELKNISHAVRPFYVLNKK